MTPSEVAHAPSPVTSTAWREQHESQRLAACEKVASSDITYMTLLDFLSASENGYVVVVLKQSLGPGERGTLLLDVEALLKAKIDQGITIWLEPQGDKSSLRNLRGIEVKK